MSLFSDCSSRRGQDLRCCSGERLLRSMRYSQPPEAVFNSREASGIFRDVPSGSGAQCPGYMQSTTRNWTPPQ